MVKDLEEYNHNDSPSNFDGYEGDDDIDVLSTLEQIEDLQASAIKLHSEQRLMDEAIKYSSTDKITALTRKINFAIESDFSDLPSLQQNVLTRTFSPYAPADNKKSWADSVKEYNIEELSPYDKIEKMRSSLSYALLNEKMFQQELPHGNNDNLQRYNSLVSEHLAQANILLQSYKSDHESLKEDNNKDDWQSRAKSTPETGYLNK